MMRVRVRESVVLCVIRKYHWCKYRHYYDCETEHKELQKKIVVTNSNRVLIGFDYNISEYRVCNDSAAFTNT